MSSGDALPADLVLLRRVLRNSCNGVMGRAAYTPGRNDTDGLSFYDAAQVTPDDLIRASGKPKEEILVLRVDAAAITALNVRLVPSPDEGPSPLPGHYLAPDLNIADYAEAKSLSTKAGASERRKVWLNLQESLANASAFIAT